MMQVYSQLFLGSQESCTYTVFYFKKQYPTLTPKIIPPRLLCHSLPITMAVPGLPVWTGNERGQEVMHVYLVAISCDVICNSQSEPAEAEFSLVCSEEITVFQWRKKV